MADDSRKQGIGRRGFFGAVAAAASGAALVKGGATPAFATETGDERTKARYQETDHVKAFYETNRYYKGE
jgi:nitrous oxide reductase